MFDTYKTIVSPHPSHITHKHSTSATDIRNIQEIERNEQAISSFIISLGNKEISGLIFYADASKATIRVYGYLRIDSVPRSFSLSCRTSTTTEKLQEKILIAAATEIVRVGGGNE